MNEPNNRHGGLSRRDLIKGAVAGWLGFATGAHSAPKASEDPPVSGSAGRDYVRSQQGATRRNVELICRVLHRIPALAPGLIATDEIG